MAIFPYFIYKEKWPKTGLKMAIKWPKMYFYEFYQILEDFLEILKICGFSAEKRPFSAFYASRNRTFFFDGKCIRAFKNAQNWLKISTLVIYNALNRI